MSPINDATFCVQPDLKAFILPSINDAIFCVQPNYLESLDEEISPE